MAKYNNGRYLQFIHASEEEYRCRLNAAIQISDLPNPCGTTKCRFSASKYMNDTKI